MCLIIRCKTEFPISEALMRNFHRQNDDGWGMMWIQDNKIKVEKSHEAAFKPLWEAYQRNKQWNPIIHVRYRTHGRIDHDNTHPFYCGYGIYLMHNGVVGVECNNNERSDTWHMVENYIKPLFARSKNPHKMIRHPDFQEKFNKMIGSSNRIVMGDRGGFVFFNPSAWHTIDNEHTGCKGMLVSNTYAWDARSFGKPVTVYKTTPLVSSRTSTGAAAGSAAVLLASETNQYDLPMFHLCGTIYEDEWHNKWIKAPDGEFVWSESLNAQDEEDGVFKETEPHSPTECELLTAHREESPTPELIVEGDEQYPEGYTEIMVRQYRSATRGELANLVYQEPDSAVDLLHYFLHQ